MWPVSLMLDVRSNSFCWIWKRSKLLDKLLETFKTLKIVYLFEISHDGIIPIVQQSLIATWCWSFQRIFMWNLMLVSCFEKFVSCFEMLYYVLKWFYRGSSFFELCKLAKSLVAYKKIAQSTPKLTQLFWVYFFLIYSAFHLK